MPQAPRVSKDEWEAHKTLITDLWINQNKTLNEVMQHMAALGFCPSRPQWIRKINVNWKLRKNSTKEEWQHASSLLSKRKGNGKDTDLVMNGKIVSNKKRMKELKRYSTLQTDQTSQVSSQFHAVVVRTPPASSEPETTCGDLSSLHIRDTIRSYMGSSNAREPRTSRSSNVPLQQHDLEPSLDNVESCILDEGDVPESSCFSEKVSRIIGMVGERFPDLDPYGDNEQSQWPVWIQLFQAFLLISKNNLWHDTEKGFSCLEYFLNLVLLTGHLEDLRTLLIRTNEANGEFAKLLLFSTIKVTTAESLKLIRILLSHGVSPNSIDPRRVGNSHWWTALHEAVYWDSERSVQLLIEFGANPHPNSEGISYMPFRIMQHHLSDCSIMELPRAPDGSDAFVGYGQSHWYPPLFQAIRNGSLDCVQMLLNAGVDPNYWHPSLLTALHCAVGMRDSGMVDILVKAGALTDILPEGKLIPPSAIIPSETRTIKTVLTPLAAAVRSQSVPIVECMLNSGAKPDRARATEKCWNSGMYYAESVESCLQIAASTGNYKMIRILLISDANPNSRHHDTPTALQIVCGSTSLSPLKRLHAALLLVRHGADINASPVPRAGRTALQATVEVNDYCLADSLLNKGADPHAPATQGGITAMEAAVKSGSQVLKCRLKWIISPIPLIHGQTTEAREKPWNERSLLKCRTSCSEMVENDPYQTRTLTRPSE